MLNFYYEPLNRIKIKFSSNELVSIRITINGEIKVIQCRTVIDFVVTLNVNEPNVIEIENLTNNVACNIDQVWLNYLNITPIMHEFAKTYTKADNNQIGEFVADIFGPDRSVITFDKNLYKKIFPYFKKGTV